MLNVSYLLEIKIETKTQRPLWDSNPRQLRYQNNSSLTVPYSVGRYHDAIEVSRYCSDTYEMTYIILFTKACQLVCLSVFPIFDNVATTE